MSGMHTDTRHLTPGMFTLAALTVAGIIAASLGMADGLGWTDIVPAITTWARDSATDILGSIGLPS